MRKRIGVVILTLSLTFGNLIGCASIEDKVYSNPVEYLTFDGSVQPESDVLALYNEQGDIKLKATTGQNVSIKVKLEQTKELRDLEVKKNNLSINPKVMDGIFLIEPLTADGNENYWQWLDDNLNENGILLDYEIGIPENIKEIRVYNEIGDICLENIKAKISAYTSIGEISGTGVTPLDDSSFTNDMPERKGSDSINVDLASLDYINNMSIGTEMGKIVVTVPEDAVYKHLMDPNFQVRDMDRKATREQCLAAPSVIKKKSGDTTTIVSSIEDAPTTSITIRK